MKRLRPRPLIIAPAMANGYSGSRTIRRPARASLGRARRRIPSIRDSSARNKGIFSSRRDTTGRRTGCPSMALLTSTASLQAKYIWRQTKERGGSFRPGSGRLRLHRAGQSEFNHRSAASIGSIWRRAYENPRPWRSPSVAVMAMVIGAACRNNATMPT